MSREPDNTSYREEQKQLKLMINKEFQNVYRLEHQISKTIYGSATEAPCSMLDHQEVVYAVTEPDLLSKDPRKQLAITRGIMEMMEEAKAHHREVLARLQVPQPRQSDRLKEKPRRDYNRFNQSGRD